MEVMGVMCLMGRGEEDKRQEKGEGKSRYQEN